MIFEPFQRVLVRDNDHDDWRCSILSHIRKSSPYKYVTVDGAWEKCVPYEGNESLVGTSGQPHAPPEPEFKFGDHVEGSDDGEQWWPAVYIRKVDGNRPHEVLKKCPWSGGGDEYWAKHCRKADW